MPWDFIAIVVFLALAVPLLGRRRMRQLITMSSTTKRDRVGLYVSTMLSQSLAAAIVLWRCEAHRVSLGELGLAVPQARLAILVAAALTGLLVANQVASVRQLGLHPERGQALLTQLAARIFPRDGTERLLFFLLVGTVAFCEEVIYRGFVQSVFEDLLGAAAPAIVASAILFGVAHLYQGRQGLIATGIMGLVFSIARTAAASLLPSIIAHFAADLTVGLLAPGRLRALASDEQ